MTRPPGLELPGSAILLIAACGFSALPEVYLCDR